MEGSSLKEINETAIQKISNIYKNNFIENNSTSTLLIVIVAILIFFIVIYYFIEINRNSILLDWNNNKCNPKYIFFSGFIQKDNPNKLQYNYDNFLECSINKSTTIKNALKSIRRTDNNLINDGNNTYQIEKNNFDTTQSTIDEKINNEIPKITNNVSNISNKMDLLYQQHQRIYNITEMYINRIILLFNNIYKYIANSFQYKLYEYKRNMDIDTFNTDLRSKYITILNTYVSNGFSSYRSKNYENSYNNINEAIDNLDGLIKKINVYNNLHKTDISNIDKLCTIMNTNDKFVNSGYACNNIFTNYS